MSSIQNRLGNITVSGTLDMNNQVIRRVKADPLDSSSCVTLQELNGVEGRRLGYSNNSTDHDIDFGGEHTAVNLIDPIAAQNAATKAYVDTQDAAHSTADRAYTDNKIDSHTHAGAATESYVDTQDAAHSTADRAYTDYKIDLHTHSGAATESYVDSQDAANSTADRAYTDTQISSHSHAGAATESYVDSQDAAQSTADRAYTDTEISSHSHAGFATESYVNDNDATHSTADRAYTDTQIDSHTHDTLTLGGPSSVKVFELLTPAVVNKVNGRIAMTVLENTINMEGSEVINSANPTLSSSLATKSYVDTSVAAGVVTDPFVCDSIQFTSANGPNAILEPSSIGSLLRFKSENGEQARLFIDGTRQNAIKMGDLSTSSAANHYMSITVNNTGVKATSFEHERSDYSNSMTRIYWEESLAAPLQLNKGTTVPVDAHTFRSNYYLAASDKRIKDNIEAQPGLDSMQKIMQLKPVNYSLKSESTKVRTGLIAQDVLKELPNAVHVQESHGYDDFHMIDYNQLIVHLVGAVQELKREIDCIRGRS
jgi:hypothetical protein